MLVFFTIMQIGGTLGAATGAVLFGVIAAGGVAPKRPRPPRDCIARLCSTGLMYRGTQTILHLCNAQVLLAF
jgi:hypothetical protein